MVRSYCVKQKKVTEYAPGSERYKRTKHGRLMLKYTCAECGITKFKFVKTDCLRGQADHYLMFMALTLLVKRF